MPVTIRDLAKKLNLSITQVSRALGGYDDVSEATRQKVIQAASEIGYEPSYAARQLRRKRADAIGYILPTSSPQFCDPFYANFLTGLADEAAQQQVDLVISSVPPESDHEKRMYQHWLQSGRVDGIVLNRVRLNDWRVEYLAQNSLPFVTLGLPKGQYAFPGIKVKERDGIEQLVLHLARKGHQRIAFISGPQELVIQHERFQGYLSGLKIAGLDFDARLVTQADLTEESGYLAGQNLLSSVELPTAILGCNDQIAIGVLRAVREAGYLVGSQLAVAGYDGIRETAFTDPPLTTLSQPTYEIARQLVNMLMKMIRREAIDPIQIELAPTLILRASTESSSP